MKTITLKGLTYSIESDSYDGDLLLLNEAQDIRIVNGYTMLREECEQKLGHEYQQHEVNYQMELNLLDFIEDNYKEGVIELHDAEDSIVEEMLAIISQVRLNKLKQSLALMDVKMDGLDPDLVWLSDRVKGAMKVKSDPAFLPFS